MPNKRIAVITGASSGMGKAASELFAKRGWIVYGGARHVENIPTHPNIHALNLDVTSSISNHNFIKTILDEQNQIDVLINNAGYGETGPVEDVSMENVRKQFETNFFGIVELTQLVLPTMRKQHSGRIVNISSIGGDIYSPLAAYYHASKAALQQWSDTLDIEVQDLGIRSTIVQPGGTQSSWGQTAITNAKKNLKPNSPYQGLINLVQDSLNSNASGMSASSTDLAALFYKAATDVNPKRRYYNSLRDHATVIIARSFPNRYRSIVRKALSKYQK